MTRPLVSGRRYGWANGDFRLVSTDGHEFHVPSALLLSVSGVFRDAGSIAGDAPKDLHFIDPELETASVINRFLQLAATNAIGDESTLLTEDDLGSYIRLVPFLRKYDCQELLAELPQCIRHKLERDEISPLHVFVLGAVLDDVELCILALKHRTTAAVVGGELVRMCAHTIAVGDIPRRFRSFIPEAFWFGLMGARRRLDSRSLIPTKRNEWDDISVDFRIELKRLKH